MRLRFCTITGADDSLDPAHLLTLSLLYPHAEWAILYAPGLEGTPRFPTRAWLDAFLATIKGRGNIAIHLCGKAVGQLENGELDEMLAPFDRMQINFSARRYRGDIEKLAQSAARVKAVTIVQMHDGNGDVYRRFGEFGHVEVLYDTSGGRGLETTDWQPPLDVPTGYAGGLRPETLIAQLLAISAAAGNSKVWCDMETGVRDAQDKFLLESARRALSLTEPYA